MSHTKLPGPDDVDELEWIQLRKELDAAAEREDNYRSYKYNWYMPVGLLTTTAFYFYGVLNMYNDKKATIGAYGRISAQLICGTVFIWSYLRYMRSKQSRLRE